MKAKEPNIKKGDIALYYDGLFRVKEITKQTDELGYEYYEAHIGNLVVPVSEIRKADWRDEVRILKGGASK